MSQRDNLHIKRTAHGRQAMRPGYAARPCPAGTSGCQPVMRSNLAGAARCPRCGRRGTAA